MPASYPSAVKAWLNKLSLSTASDGSQASVTDEITAIQSTLGTNPQVDSAGTDRGTVAARLTAIEGSVGVGAGLLKANNLSDVASTATALANLGAEATANKSNSAALGTSSVVYPTQGAVKSYVDSAIASVSTVSSAIKRVTTPLGGPGNQSATLAQPFTSRYPMILPVTPSRWRLRIKNWAARAGTAGTGTYTMTAYYGTPAPRTTGTYRWDGTLTAAPTPITWGGAGSSSMTGSTEITSDWMTGGITANQQFAISLGCTLVTSPYNVFYDSVGGLCKAGAGADAQAATAAFSTGSLVNGPYFDVRIEYEYVTQLRADGWPAVPVAMYIGDSITLGQAQAETVTSGTIWPFECWAGASALRNGYAYVNAAIGGTRLYNGAGTGWADSTNFTNWLSRFDLATSLPDVCIISLGVNDCANNVTLANQQSAFSSIVTNLRNLGIKRIYVCTASPGGNGLPASVTGTTSTTSPTVTLTLPSNPGALIYQGTSTAFTATTLTDTGASFGTDVVGKRIQFGTYTGVVSARTSSTQITVGTHGQASNQVYKIWQDLSMSGLSVNMPLSGTGIASGATIVSIDSETQFTMSTNGAATGTNSITVGGLSSGSSTQPYLDTDAKEGLRQQVNAWLRTLPSSIDGCFDFQTVMEVPSKPSVTYARYAQYYPHFLREGHQAMAQVIRLP